MLTKEEKSVRLTLQTKCLDGWGETRLRQAYVVAGSMIFAKGRAKQQREGSQSGAGRFPSTRDVCRTVSPYQSGVGIGREKGGRRHRYKAKPPRSVGLALPQRLTL